MRMRRLFLPDGTSFDMILPDGMVAAGDPKVATTGGASSGGCSPWTYALIGTVLGAGTAWALLRTNR